MSKKINIAKLQKDAEAVRDEWLEKIDVKARITQLLDARMEEVVAKLLGFNSRWRGEWEVDSCNGRMGESAAGDYLREKCGVAVKEWLDKAAGDLPPLPKAAVRSLVSRYHEMLERAILGEIQKKAQRDAQAMVESMIQNVAAGEPADVVRNGETV